MQGGDYDAYATEYAAYVERREEGGVRDSAEHCKLGSTISIVRTEGTAQNNVALVAFVAPL